jgi:hypothetical protein
MRKLALLCAVVLLSSVAAASQNIVPTLVGPIPAAAPAPASPQGPADGDLTDWQLSIGYQFTRFNMPAVKGLPAFQVNDNGLNSSLTRYLTNSVGLEAAVAAGFGSASTPAITSAKSVFVGGGLHLARRGRGRIEPWVHGVVGMERFRFSQTATVYSSNITLGYVVGGGADYHLNPRTAIRLEADYLGTHLFFANQAHWQIVAGAVFNF